MIALRNVMDARKRLVLANGGVYELPYGIIRNRDQRTIDVETLVVGPLDVLLNEDAWDGENWELLLGLIMDESSARSAADAETEIYFNDRPQPLNWIRPRDRYHAEVRPALQRRLNLFRVEAEAGLALKDSRGRQTDPSERRATKSSSRAQS